MLYRIPRVWAILIVMLAVNVSALAQVPATDYGTHNEPALPALPGVGGTFTDAIYGSTYLQLTSAAEGRGTCDTNYPYYTGLSPDSSKVFIDCYDSAAGIEYPVVKTIDPVAMTIVSTISLPTSYSGDQPAWGMGWFWLDNDNLLVMGTTTPRLFKYTVSSNSFSVYKDFSSLLPAGDILRQFFMSSDRDVLSANWLSSGFALKGYVAIRLSSLTLLKQVTNPQINEAHLDKSGRYLVVDFYDTSLITVHDLLLNTTTQLTQGAPDYAESHHVEFDGFEAGGNADWAGGNCHFATGRSLTSPHTVIDLMPLAANDCSQGQHSSNGAAANTWMLNSTFNIPNSGAHTNAPFHNELYLVKTDGSGQVYRFGHHWSRSGSADSDIRYYETPRASISSDGRFATFNSNMMAIDGHRDVFLVRIPNSPADNTAAVATFVGTDSATQGSWQGVYGSDGYNVIGDGASYPSYAQVTPSGQQLWAWAASTTEPRALRKVSGTDRISACWHADPSFTIDVNLTDGQPHQVAIYELDGDSGGRSQTVEVLDATSGAVLDTRSVSAFSQGQYLVWNIKGHVRLRFTRSAGDNAVVSGLFFSGASASASFAMLDTTTQGSWKGVYGGDGYNVIGDSASYPAYAQVTPAGQQLWTWAASSTDPRALQKASAADRIAATWYSTGTAFTIDLNLTDAETHRVALYMLDWDDARSQTVDVLDVSTGVVLDSRNVSGFSQGQYLVWNIRGHVQIKLTQTAGANAVVSGLFFDAGHPN